MKLYELIETFSRNQPVDVALILPYKRSLRTYYQNWHLGEPILMITSVFNAGALGLVVPADEYHEAVYSYLAEHNPETEYDSEDWNSYVEVISANSRFLKDF
jgi:hypothetical protein